jgi:hypothetical protein
MFRVALEKWNALRKIVSSIYELWERLIDRDN